jgi:hypothetical protein
VTWDARFPGIGKPLTLTTLDLGGNRWVAWVRKLSLQAYVAKTALSPDKQLLVSIKGLAQRWNCSDKYIYRLIQAEKLELTVIEDTYGQKVGVGVSYAEVQRYEKLLKRSTHGKLKNIVRALTVDPDPQR